MNCGIYQIRNERNGKRYVGSSCDFTRRWKEHRGALRSRRHYNPILSRAWEKYGAESFRFSALLVCDERDLLFYENRVIQGMNPEYNVATVAGTTRGIKYSDEARAKISKAMMGNKRAVGRATSEKQRAHLIGNKYGKGRIKSAAQLKAISVANKGNSYALGYKNTPEMRAAKSARMKALWASRKSDGLTGNLGSKT